MTNVSNVPVLAAQTQVKNQLGQTVETVTHAPTIVPGAWDQSDSGYLQVKDAIREARENRRLGHVITQGGDGRFHVSQLSDPLVATRTQEIVHGRGGRIHTIASTFGAKQVTPLRPDVVAAVDGLGRVHDFRPSLLGSSAAKIGGAAALGAGIALGAKALLD